jgi:hypothetical protein
MVDGSALGWRRAAPPANRREDHQPLRYQAFFSDPEIVNADDDHAPKNYILPIPEGRDRQGIGRRFFIVAFFTPRSGLPTTDREAFRTVPGRSAWAVRDRDRWSQRRSEGSMVGCCCGRVDLGHADACLSGRVCARQGR